MPRLKAIQNSMAAGELDPLLRGRTDIKHYFSGLEKARNVFLIPQGGAKRRPGFEFIDIMTEIISRETGQTITATNGGVTANANDDDTTTEVVTTVGISTTDPYVVVHYDLGSAKLIKFADVVGFRLDAGSSTGEFRVQYSTDDIAWSDFGTATMDASTTDNTRRHHSATAITARYWRFVRIGATDLTTSIAAIDELNLWIESGTLSAARAVAFVFSTTQSYKLIFSDRNLAVYKGKVLQAHVRSPYISAQLDTFNWTQSLDTMFMFNNEVAPYRLQRGTADDLWDITLLTLDSIPRFQFTPASSTPAATLTPSAVTGTVTLTASAGVFSSANVGQFVNGNGGRARIIAFTSTTIVKAYMETPFFDTDAVANPDWDLETGYEDAWSTARGWPICGSFHQGRLVIGGSTDLPMTLWLSKVSDFTNFDLGTNLDDEGIAVTLASDDVAAIRQIFSGRHLQIFTSSAEFFVPSAAAITPNTIEFRRTTNFGAAESLRVWNVDGATIFVNRTGGAVREFLFVDTEQAYQAASLSLLASHLVVSPVDSAFRKSTSTEDADYLLLVNSDGTLAIMNTLRTQDITGWSLMETQGLVKASGVELDTMFFVVQRNINGADVMHIEYFDTENSLDASTVIKTGLPTDTFSGLDHLEGETVEVIADGNRLTPVTISGGSATIERDAETIVEFGLRFKAAGDDYTIKTMPIERELQDGTMIGRKKRVVEVTLLVDNTKSVKVNGNRVAFRSLGDDLLDSSTPSFTGQKVIEGLLGFSDEAQIEIGDDVPLPATINSIAYKVAV